MPSDSVSACAGAGGLRAKSQCLRGHRWMFRGHGGTGDELRCPTKTCCSELQKGILKDVYLCSVYLHVYIYIYTYIYIYI